MLDLIARMEQLKRTSEVRQPEARHDLAIENDLVNLYREITVRDETLAASQAETPDDLSQRDPVLQALENRFQNGWQGLSDQQRRQVFDKLTETGVLPEFVGKTMELFGGKVIRMVGER